MLLILCASAKGEKGKTDANIVGHVLHNNKHLSFVNISLKGTTIGILTDETGHYKLINLPENRYAIVASVLGFKTIEKIIDVKTGNTIEVNFEMEEDVLNLDDVVVSSNRSEQKRMDAVVVVNTIAPKLFSSSQAINLSEGLNFCPGLRMENNCQNCGFTQLRMNGMEGPYSQILINSRPVFSGLAGVYGLELIPANMIERVEIVRGGGSALFGSNAIAGTVNIILKDPITNSYELGVNTDIPEFNKIGNYTATFNTNIISPDTKTGIAVYGFNRRREAFDANRDGFSETSEMDNSTIGTKFFRRFNNKNKISIDFFNIKEERAGGNKFDSPLHERDVAEAVKHDMKNLSLVYEQYFHQYDLLTAYISGQYLKRDSYYGADKSLKDYGKSVDRTYNAGIQYKISRENINIVSGVENTGGFLRDKKLGYPDIENAIIINDSIQSIPHTENSVIANQYSLITGIFTQFDYKLGDIKFSAGARYDNYRIDDVSKELNAKTGSVFSPRLAIMYRINKLIQTRLSYSQGFRSPQIFDEDLHIETSGSRQIFHKNDPALKQESSNSISTSIDLNKGFGQHYLGFLIESFYTRLEKPFVNDIGSPDEKGIVIYTRKNAENGATVKGFNSEIKYRYSKIFSANGGYTLQSSRYDKDQAFNEKDFFKSPKQYGFVAIDFDLTESLCFNLTGNYTGKMKVPYFGPLTDDNGELRITEDFFDMGTKISYLYALNGAKIDFFAGIKNIFNSYQRDFDLGINRDPAYMYGPMQARTLYLGIKIGNMLRR